MGGKGSSGEHKEITTNVASAMRTGGDLLCGGGVGAQSRGSGEANQRK